MLSGLFGPEGSLIFFPRMSVFFLQLLASGLIVFLDLLLFLLSLLALYFGGCNFFKFSLTGARRLWGLTGGLAPNLVRLVALLSGDFRCVMTVSGWSYDRWGRFFNQTSDG